MDLSREELIDLGQSVPFGVLAAWASDQLDAARRTAERLQRRGVHSQYLAEIASLMDAVRKLHGKAERQTRDGSEELEPASQVHDEAFNFWREVKLMAVVEFGADPDTLARFRTGVKLGPSIPKLANEVRRLLPLLREYSAQLGWLGVSEDFIKEGEGLLARLQEAQAKKESDVRNLAPHEAELNFQKGRLFDLTRKLVRIGRLEFSREPEHEGLFNYDILRRRRVARSLARSRAEKVSVG